MSDGPNREKAVIAPAVAKIPQLASVIGQPRHRGFSAARTIRDLRQWSARCHWREKARNIASPRARVIGNFRSCGVAIIAAAME